MVRVLACIALALGGVAPAWAQEVPIPARLSLEDALRIAAERNPDFLAAQNELEIAQAGVLDARIRPNPALTVDSEGYPLSQQDSRSPFFNNQELSIRIDQEIETAGRRRLRVDTAQTAVTTARFRRRDRLRLLELEVKRAYFQAVLAASDRDVAQTSLKEIDQVIALNRARLQEGEISGADVRRLQVERLRFADDVFAADLAVRNARGALLALLNADDLGQPFDVVDALEPPTSATQIGTVAVSTAPTVTLPAAALFQQATVERPDLVAARQEQLRADTETRLQRALRSPNVTLGAGYKRDFGTNALVFGVTVPLALSNRNQGGIARAEAEGRLAANQVVAAATTVRLDVQQALNALDINRQRVDYIRREYLMNARESRDIVLESYRLGAADLIDFLDAQRAFRDTQRTFNRALYDERVSVFELQSAVGVTDVRLP